ncbi:MAG: AraC family transcriptional regulator [Ruminococcaceae bacterium]|nr:AraC family transcriptional regulator [Oscillospiraceae bacterium]
MAEPKDNMYILFPENKTMLLQLASIGYNDFRKEKPLKFMRVQDGYTIHYVRNGKGTLVIGKNKYEVRAGELFFIPPDTPMMYYPDETDPWRYFWFYLRDVTTEMIAGAMGFSDNKPIIAPLDARRITQLLDNLFAEDGTLSEMYYKALSVLMQMLATLAGEKMSNDEESKKEGIVKRAKEIIELNYKETTFSVDIIAQMLYISRSKLNRAFKEMTGMAPVAYLALVRMNHAADFLTRRDWQVKELSLAVGIKDEFYFMKQFKKVYGMTVKAYRKKVQSDNTPIQ